MELWSTGLMMSLVPGRCDRLPRCESVVWSPGSALSFGPRRGLLRTADFECSRSGSLRTVFESFLLVFGGLAIGVASFCRDERHEPNALSCPSGRLPVLTGPDLPEADLMAN